MASETYDYIIAGGGTAGLVLAARLSEDSNTRILVLEAGDDLTSDPRVVTPAMWPALLNTTADWALQTVPQSGLQGRTIKFPQGRLLGGSSGLNGLTFTATSKSNIDSWAQLGNPGWDWASLSKYLRKSYTLSKPSRATAEGLGLPDVDASVHGLDGPLQLSYPEQPENEWPKAWLETIEALGYPAISDPFSGATYGAIISAESIDPAKRQRSFASNAYLEPAKARRNITVVTGAQVDKIILSGDAPQVRAEGVQYRKGEQTLTVHTTGEVLVTAGAIHSPRLLELSGIGNEQLLRPQGISAVINNPNVGENLQNHLMSSISFEVNDGFSTIDSISRQDPSTLGAAMEAYSKQTGPFASGGTFASAQLPFPHIDQSEGKEDLKQLLKQETIQSSPPFADAHRKYVESVLTSATEASVCHISFPGYATGNPDGTMAGPPAGTENYFTVVSLLCHPLSRGSVHLDANQPSGLAIDPNYLSNPLDLEVMARHVRFVDNELIKANPLSTRIKNGGKRNASAPASIDDLDTARDYIKRTAVGAHHFTGTCSMMPREMGGVVDADLRVYGTVNLRVCDASIIPLTPRVNPQATVYAVAERAADLIRRK